MKYHILTVGLKNNLISWCQKYFSEKNTEVRIALDIKEVAQTLKKETFHLLVFDMDYLRSIGQSGWLLNIRNITFIPMVVLSGIPDVDVGPAVEAGADVCFDSNLSPVIISTLLLAQLRRYATYNHFDAPETNPFQVGDTAIDPSRHQVWVCGEQVVLFAAGIFSSALLHAESRYRADTRTNMYARLEKGLPPMRLSSYS